MALNRVVKLACSMAYWQNQPWSPTGEYLIIQNMERLRFKLCFGMYSRLNDYHPCACCVVSGYVT